MCLAFFAMLPDREEQGHYALRPPAASLGAFALHAQEASSVAWLPCCERQELAAADRQ